MLPDFFFFLMAPPLIRGKEKWWQKTSEDSCMILLRLPENYQLHQIKFTVRSSFSVALWGKWLRFYTATYAYRGSMIIMGQLSASLCHTLVQYCIIYKWQTTWRSDFAAKCDIFYVLGFFFFFLNNEFVEQTITNTGTQTYIPQKGHWYSGITLDVVN